MSRPAAPTLRERSPVRRLMSSYLAFAFSCRSFWSERTKEAPVAKKRHKYGKLAYEASVLDFFQGPVRLPTGGVAGVGNPRLVACVVCLPCHRMTHSHELIMPHRSLCFVDARQNDLKVYDVVLAAD